MLLETQGAVAAGPALHPAGGGHIDVEDLLEYPQDGDLLFHRFEDHGGDLVPVELGPLHQVCRRGRGRGSFFSTNTLSWEGSTPRATAIITTSVLICRHNCTITCCMVRNCSVV